MTPCATLLSPFLPEKSEGSVSWHYFQCSYNSSLKVASQSGQGHFVLS